MKVILCAVLLLMVACTPGLQAEDAATSTTDSCSLQVAALKVKLEREQVLLEQDLPATATRTRAENLEVFGWTEKLAILAEQHPECFSVVERVEVESAYRHWLRWWEAQ